MDNFKGISNCGYDMAGKLLGHVLTNLKTGNISKLNPPDHNWKKLGILKRFSQD